MPRRERLDFRGAVHHVVLRGATEREVFLRTIELQTRAGRLRQCAPHALQLERIIAESCVETAASLHAYCVRPNACDLLMRVEGVPLKGVMQRLCGRFARYLRAMEPDARRVFARRYQSKLVAPEHLAHAMRRIHLSISAAGLWTLRIAYPFGSDGAYRGYESAIRVSMSDVQTALERQGYAGADGYRRFMGEAETTYLAKLLTSGSPLDRRVIGGRVYVQRSLHLAQRPRARLDREDLVAAATRLLGMAPEVLQSGTPAGALARALVAWHGLRTGAATLREMGRWFGVSATALWQGIERHRDRHPELFNGLDLIPPS